MSDRDDLIAKARDLDRRLPEGPWQVEGVSGGQADIADNRGNWIATIRKDFDGTDDPLIIELRTLLPALADLAESEGRRADEAEKKLAEARIRNHGPAMLYLAEEHVSIRKAIGLPGDCEPDVIVEHFERIVAERDAALAELAALKGQQP